MKSTPHADYEELLRRVHVFHYEARSWSGIIYRSATVKYSRPGDIISGDGSRIHGGRWNAPDTFPAVYGSISPETALAESLAFHRNFGIPVFKAMPRVFVAIDCSLKSVLDLRDRNLTRRLGVPSAQTVSLDWRAVQDNGAEALTQALGRACHDAGLEGILVRSAADRNGHNVVVFPDCLLPGSVFTVLNPGELP
jgi:RES domain-containing protein